MFIFFLHFAFRSFISFIVFIFIGLLAISHHTYLFIMYTYLDTIFRGIFLFFLAVPPFSAAYT